MTKSLVLFDVGGVLLELNYSGLYRRGAELTGTTPEQFKQRYNDDGLELEAMTGAISNEEYQIRMKKMLGNPKMSCTELEANVSICWGKDIKPVVALKQRAYFEGNALVGIFSNINQFGWEYLSRTFPGMFETFNPKAPRICSYLSGDVKPNFPMYNAAQKAAKKLNCSKVILVEDKESYLKIGVEKFGWNGILFTPFIDTAESIRSTAGHNDSFSSDKIKIANSVSELEKALRESGISM